MDDEDEQVSWSVVWKIIKGSDLKARRRALRETLTVLGVSILPIALGAFLAYVETARSAPSYPSYLHFLSVSIFGGQLFLLFLSLTGTIFARLWDPDGPRYAFSVALNLVCLCGAALAGGLLGIDADMKSFTFLPVGLMSVLLFAIVVVYYFVLAIPSYIEKPDIQGNLKASSQGLQDDLSARMNPNGA